MTTLDRFFSKIEYSDSGCWNWTGAKHVRGYGKFAQHPGWVLAHRFAFELFRYEIPKELELDHLCRNPSCVNPFHIQAVTHRVNVRRGVGPPGLNAQKLYCVRGHKLTGLNLKLGKKGKRYCVACAKIRDYLRYKTPVRRKKSGSKSTEFEKVQF